MVKYVFKFSEVFENPSDLNEFIAQLVRIVGGSSGYVEGNTIVVVM